MSRRAREVFDSMAGGCHFGYWRKDQPCGKVTVGKNIQHNACYCEEHFTLLVKNFGHKNYQRFTEREDD